MARNTKAPSMSNPFAPDATKAAIRALTQPMTPIQPEPVQPEPPKIVAPERKPEAQSLSTLGPRTIVLSDADVLEAQKYGYLRGCRDLSAVFRAALEVLLKADEAGLVEVSFSRKTGDRGGRPVYEHQVNLNTQD
ncbi:MAG TPA: hypothetical protein PLL06_23195 [Acidobacteriota bacterium]|nr:hypothetical protein [Acidobacteriota bacterium]HMZ82621.1 hypothetical protein [Acidobacteriota bacterium]HNB71930.1 hypothetical protein [Acidobacteriota bacterium]HND18488.1 hypothetical protein [Acidobacteriota bacterium]HNG92422.1 hypothetical protein [Acidobacteriota bacterium]